MYGIFTYIWLILYGKLVGISTGHMVFFGITKPAKQYQNLDHSVVPSRYLKLYQQIYHHEIRTGPGNYINLCGPHMLSIAGRCFTFDMSAAAWRKFTPTV